MPARFLASHARKEAAEPLSAAAGVGCAPLRLNSFLIFENKIAKPEKGWVFRDSLLHPPFVQFGVAFEADSFRLRVFQVAHCRLPMLGIVFIGV